MEFDPLQIANEIAESMIPRFATLGMTPEENQEDSGILREFCKIAAGMLRDEPVIEMPGVAQRIELDQATFTQALTLFIEGIYLAMIKCLEMNISGDTLISNPQDPNMQIKAKNYLLENLALDVFNQAKQVVATTYGQEHTPDLQIGHEQQVQFMAQTAESALIYYITEYERQHGPILVEEPPARLLPKVEQAMVEDGVPLPVAAPAPAQAKPKGPTPHDKYGAVALLLGTIPAEQRGRILQNFNAEEKELITYYSYPDHLEQNLDLTCVNEHLRRFKELMKQGGPTLKSAAYRGISRLAKSRPLTEMLSYIKDERAVVKQYLESHYNEPLEHLPVPQKDRHFADLLPPRIEEILYRYLAKRVEAQG